MVPRKVNPVARAVEKEARKRMTMKMTMKVTIILSKLTSRNQLKERRPSPPIEKRKSNRVRIKKLRILKMRKVKVKVTNPNAEVAVGVVASEGVVLAVAKRKDKQKRQQAMRALQSLRRNLPKKKSRSSNALPAIGTEVLVRAAKDKAAKVKVRVIVTNKRKSGTSAPHV